MSHPLVLGVVGASGQIGTRLLRSLSRDDRFRIVGICRNELTAGMLRLEGFEARVGSLTGTNAGNALLGDCDVVVNCAYPQGTPAAIRQEDRLLAGSLCSLTDLAALIHLSTVEVYGRYVDRDRQSFEGPRPSTVYGIEKRFMERRLASLTHSSIKLFILRTGHVFGDRQSWSRTIAQNARDGMPLPHNGELPSNAVHAENVVEAVRMAALGTKPSGTYNLVNEPQWSWRQVYDWHSDALGSSRVPDMGEEKSVSWRKSRRRHAARGIMLRTIQEVGVWLRSLPRNLVEESPAIRTLGGMALLSLGSTRLDNAMRTRFSAYASGGTGEAEPDPLLLSDAVPGPNFIERDVVTDGDQRAFAEWQRQWSGPENVERLVRGQ